MGTTLTKPRRRRNTVTSKDDVITYDLVIQKPHLFLPNKKLTEIPHPKQLESWAAELKSVYLNNNNIHDISIFGELKFPNLTEISLSGNKLGRSSLKGIGTLNCLKSLNLNDNDIQTLAIDLQNLKNLTELHIENNQLKDFSFPLVNLENLEVLNLNYNNLSFEAVQRQNFPSKLRVLRIGFNELGSIPQSILNLTKLTELDLRRNMLMDLPNELCNFNLEKLDLAINILSKKLPDLNWSKFKLLDISFNSFSTLPIPIELLTSAQTIEMSGNPFIVEFTKNIYGNSIHMVTEFPLPDRIVENLYLGPWRSAFNYSGLQQLGIRHILVAGRELRPAFPEKFDYLHLNIDDDENQNLLPLFPQTTNWIESLLNKKEGILVHCKAGVSRSATLILAYLIGAKDYNFADAFKFVKSLRATIEPNKSFKEQLQIWEVNSK